MAEARDAGVEKADLISMVTDVYNVPQVNDAEPAPAAEAIYDELPEGLIDLPSAAKKYGCTVGRLRNWVYRGKINQRGKLKASAPGGGLLLVSRSDVERALEAPQPKGGRPRKT